MFLKRARLAASAARDAQSSAPPMTATDALRVHLVGMFVRKQLSAKDICVTAYYITQAGGRAWPTSPSALT